MSVATRVVAAPPWKASMLRVRAPWLRLPCSSTAGTPEALSCLASFLAPCLVRVNITVRPGAAARSSSTGSRSSLCTWSTWCAIVETGDCAESASWVTGLERKRFTRTFTPASRVAENSSRWPSRGVRSMMRRTTGRKPRSAMWSASSSTVISTASRSTWPWPMRSSRRPGQATTTSTPRRRAVTCGFWPTPPKTVWLLRPRGLASGMSAVSIWVASSRVGARIRARGREGRRLTGFCDSRASSGSRKA